MSTKYPLHETLSPIDRVRRMQLNENWQRITSYFEYVQTQIKVLAGGKEVDEVIARLEEAINKANSDVASYILQLDQTVQQAIENNDTATQDAIDANNTATQNAINANNANLQTALQSVTDALTLIDTAISNAATATQEATEAKDATIQATNDAQNAITAMDLLINNFVPRGVFAAGTQYYKNNIVRDEEGNSYIARDNNINVGLADTTKWMLFAKKGDKGERGERGEQGTGLNIIGSLTDISQLPVSGNPGDAYTVNGFLYIWSENTESWEDNGNIKGEKGEKGDPGDDGKTAYEVAVANGFIGTEAEWIMSLKGEKGDTPDLTNIEQSIASVKRQTDQHLAESGQFELYHRSGVKLPVANTTGTSLPYTYREIAGTGADFSEIDANGDIRFKKAGTYLMNVRVAFDHNGVGHRYFGVVYNGGIIFEEARDASSRVQTYLSLTKIIKVSAGDVIGIAVFQDSGGTVNVDGNLSKTFMELNYLGNTDPP